MQIRRKYLLFITKPYSFPILEPIQEYIHQENLGEVRWFTASTAKDISPPGPQLITTEEVKNFRPEVIIVPGNVVPHFWPGLKVQVFHGLGDEKKSPFAIRGFFDLYCTSGNYMTDKFRKLAENKGHFLVRETGWPKMDKLNPDSDRSKLKAEFGFNPEYPVLLYAPTFSPKYTSAPALLPEIIQILKTMNYQWLLKFHDLMDDTIINEYKAIAGSRLKIIETYNIIPLLEVSDILITDTSSVAYEYLLLDRPIITYKATERLDKGININFPSDLSIAIERSLTNPDEFSSNRSIYLTQLHPYKDRASSRRVIEAVEEVLYNGLHLNLKRKPLNLIRKWQVRRMITL